MRAGDLMQDPFYAQILFTIEGLIHDHDLKVQAHDQTVLKDSIVKSALRKAMTLMKGTSQLSSPKDQEERIKAALTIELLSLYEHQLKPQDLSRGDYIKVLHAVEDTLVTRREMAGHPRGYLDFLKQFIPEARGNQPDQTA